MNYTPKVYNLSELVGISEKQVTVHLALYEGYVKHVNLIMDKLAAVREGTLELDPYIVAELRRRFGFEFDGMRMHEYYFEQFSGGPTALDSNSALAVAATKKYGDAGLIAHIKEVANSRGIGWVVVYADSPRLSSSEAGPRANTLHTVFVNDHELGQLSGLPIVLALDLWEHAYMVDYVPADKKNYIEAFFSSVNWGVIEKRFDEAIKAIAP